MHVSTDTSAPRTASFLRTRLLHVAAPVALSIGLLVAGYTVLSDFADSVAATVTPTRSERILPAATPVANAPHATAIAAN